MQLIFLQTMRSRKTVSELKLELPWWAGESRTAVLLTPKLPEGSGGMSSPEWIKKAETVARSFRAATAGERGATYSVYVVLLHDPLGGGRWGLYVGQTSRDPDLRFDQHKTGHKASRAVRRFGVRLLPNLVEHLNPMKRWESLEIEAALAEGFRDAGILWIEGGH